MKEQLELACNARGSVETHGLLGKCFGSSHKSNHTVTWDLTIILLDIYSQEIKLYFDKKTCTKMFKATLFVIASNEKQSK